VGEISQELAVVAILVITIRAAPSCRGRRRRRRIRAAEIRGAEQDTLLL
jgi:hypothetical protein